MSRLSKNILYNLTGQGVILILSFAAVRYIFQRLGEDVLGIIYFTVIINTVFRRVLDMGISFTTVREVSSCFESEPEYVKKLVRTFSLFYWMSYTLFGIVIFFLAPLLVEKWINLKNMDTGTAIYTLRILGIASFLAMPTSFYNSILRGLQRMDLSNLIEVTFVGLQQVGIVFALILGGNLLHVIYWFVVCYTAKVFAYFAVLIRLLGLWHLIPRCFPEVVSRNLRFASTMMSVSVISGVHTQIDKIIISKMLPIGMVGYYGFAYNNVSKISTFANAVFQAAFPSFSNMFKSRDHKSLTLRYRQLQDLISFGTLPIFIGVAFASFPLFSYVLNVQTAKILLLPTVLLCVGFYMNGTLNFPHIFAIAANRPGISARQNLYALFLILPLMLVSVHYLRLTGAAFCWILYQIFGYFYGVRRIYRECLGIRASAYYLYMLRIFAVIFSTYGVAGLTLATIGAYSVPALVLAYIGATLAFMVGGYFTADDASRAELSSFYRVLRAKFMALVHNQP
jgi:O-antigen/teichoic acid export membrane protein